MDIRSDVARGDGDDDDDDSGDADELDKAVVVGRTEEQAFSTTNAPIRYR